MTEQQDNLRTVRETNHIVRSLIETEQTLRDYFWVGGRLTKFHKSDFGHAYFTLEDENYSIRCMLPNNNLGKANFPLENGIFVDVYGKLSVYQKWAQVQIEVEDIKLVDKGTAEFNLNVMEQLKEQELWPKSKKELPNNPEKIILITSQRSAAHDDFYHKYHEEMGRASIDDIDVLLEGERAPSMIADAIERANQEQRGDIIVLTRGGGRKADLSVFNDIQIAEAICKSQIPVITGIGHAEDDTIADRVADATTITPTAVASELAKLSRIPQKPIISQSTEAEIPTQSQAGINPIYIGIGAIIIVLLLFLILQNL